MNAIIGDAGALHYHHPGTSWICTHGTVLTRARRNVGVIRWQCVCACDLGICQVAAMVKIGCCYCSDEKLFKYALRSRLVECSNCTTFVEVHHKLTENRGWRRNVDKLQCVEITNGAEKVQQFFELCITGLTFQLGATPLTSRVRFGQYNYSIPIGYFFNFLILFLAIG